MDSTQQMTWAVAIVAIVAIIAMVITINKVQLPSENVAGSATAASSCIDDRNGHACMSTGVWVTDYRTGSRNFYGKSSNCYAGLC